jgi:DNA-binding NarL/FixJ family response regulator
MLKLIPGRNGNHTPAVRVLVLNESAVVAELLTRELERSGLKLLSERADSEKQFTHALRSFAPDVVLSAPAVGGFNAKTALRLLQATRPTAPLILVAEQFDEAAVACLRAGAETVVMKCNLSELAPATQQALLVRQPLRTLSRRQLEVLRLVSEGLTSKEIAREFGLSVKTVETHRGSGMRRLGAEDIAGLVRYAVRVGLVSYGPRGSVNGGGIVKVAASDTWSQLQLAAD